MSEFTNELYDYYSDVAKTHGFQTIWSMYEVKDMFAKHPHGDVTHVYYDGGWGKPTIAGVKGDTWLDLWDAANRAIIESGDHHHVFVEAIRKKDGAFGVVSVTTGS